MLHGNFPRNNRIRSAIVTLFMNLNLNGESPHQWNFNSNIYRLRQNANKHTHIVLCAQKMRRTHWLSLKRGNGKRGIRECREIGELGNIGKSFKRGISGNLLNGEYRGIFKTANNRKC